MFAASVLIVIVNVFLCISFDLRKERTKERKKKEKPFFSNRELLSTRKYWTINPSLAQAHHRHYRHIAFISFQLKISTPFRKLSTKKIHCIQCTFLFCFNLFQISLQFYMCKNNGEMVWQEVTRRRRCNALKLSCMTTKYVFWSPIFPSQTTKLPPPNRFLSQQCLFERFTTSIAECKSGFATERNLVPVDTPPDEMASSPLHIGKPVTSRHCLTF